MQVPDQTVRTRMLGLALPLKEEMLRTAASASPTFKAPTRASHHRGRSINTVGDSSLFVTATGPVHDRKFRPGDNAMASTSGIKSFLRKAKSNSSLRAQNVHDSATATTSTPVASRVRARSRSHSRAASTSSVFRGFGKSSGAGSAGAVPSDSAGCEGEGPAYWASRLRAGTITTLQVRELGRLRGRLRNESPV